MSNPFSPSHVISDMPPELERLAELAYNLWWTWNHEAGDLFRQLDPDLWEKTGQNPVLLLGIASRTRLRELARDDEFLRKLKHICQKLDDYMVNQPSPYEKTCLASGKACIAYFCAEFGITGCLPLYAGGLGVLAGDHLKSASDLRLPLVGVGLLYQKGYFSQYISRDGRQGELYPSHDFHNMPLQLQRQEDGTPVTIKTLHSPYQCLAQVWRAQVGHVPLFLLDTNLPANYARDRQITDRLYDDDQDVRIRQEIVLGIGGMRALDAMGIMPAVCHLNEGHAAFAALERIRLLMSRLGLSFAEAREIVSASSIFTTHTSVPTGIDRYPPQLMDKYFCNYYPLLGLPRSEFLALGRQNPRDESEPFSMPVLAFRLSAQANAVSKLHGKVSYQLWQNIWPDLPEEKVPITSVTNGIHLQSWVSGDHMARLLDRYLGPAWHDNASSPTTWQRVDEIPDEELWQAHEQCRERLVALVHQRLCAQREQGGAAPGGIRMAEEALRPKVLTIGFARRFATYKRSTLILHHPERLFPLLTNQDHPVQIVFAGKAHPNDNSSKELIRQIISFERLSGLHRHLVVLEDYDLSLAQHLVQGADLWLNTPRRPVEASGTSGMKAAANGVLNLSILDGWWPEAYQPEIGWAIGSEKEYNDPTYQDEIDAQSIYDQLEEEIIPLFYDRDSNGLPRGWIKRMKATMRAVCPAFNSTRMVQEYSDRFYIPAATQYQGLTQHSRAQAEAPGQR